MSKPNPLKDGTKIGADVFSNEAFVANVLRKRDEVAGNGLAAVRLRRARLKDRHKGLLKSVAHVNGFVLRGAKLIKLNAELTHR